VRVAPGAWVARVTRVAGMVSDRRLLSAPLVRNILAFPNVTGNSRKLALGY
jgi:hypothetical protein